MKPGHYIIEAKPTRHHNVGREVPKPRTDWLIPVRARMIAELERISPTEQDLRAHLVESSLCKRLIDHLVEVGLEESGEPSPALGVSEKS